MTTRVPLVAIAIAIALVAGPSPAALPPRADEVSAAYYAALDDLRAGKERRGIADRLGPAVEKHPASPYRMLAGPLLDDLAGSPAGAAQPLEPPETRLADTRAPLALLRYAENWGGPLAAFVKKEPKDPVAELAAADRAVIGRLVPGGPGDVAGLQSGDVILEFDGIAIPTFLALVEKIGLRQPGDKVVVVYTRDGEKKSVTVELDEFKI